MVDDPDGLWRLPASPMEVPVTTTAVIALGVIAWVLMAIVLSLFLVRMNRRNRPRTLDAELPAAHLAGNPPTANPPTANPPTANPPTANPPTANTAPEPA